MSIDIKNIRTQLYMLERATRAIRVHIEAQQEVLSQSNCSPARIPLVTGLEKLLSSSNDIQLSTPQPHERFFPGVWVGYVASDNNFGVKVHTRCHPPVDQGQSFEDFGASSLVLTVAAQETQNLWLTLETEIPCIDIVASHGLDVRFILSFIDNSQHPLGPIGLQLGVTHENGFESHFRRDYPALDVPLELSYSLTKEQITELTKEPLKNVSLMITLPIPVNGCYTAILSHFEVITTLPT